VPDSVVMKIIDTESTAANLILSNEANAAVINGPDLTRVTAAGATAKAYVSGGVVYEFNEAAGRVTSDKAVRTALTQLLNRADVATAVTQGIFKTAGTSISAAQPQICNDESAASSIPKYDASAAASTLTAAGYAKGSDGYYAKGGVTLTVDLGYSTATPGAAAATQLMADAWNKGGIKTTITPHAQAEYTQIVFTTGAYDVMLSQFANPFPSTLISLLQSAAATNAGKIKNAAYDTAVAAAQVATTPEAACAQWTAASKAVFESVDMIPVSQWPSNWVTKGAVMDTLGGRPIAESIRMLKQ